MRISTLVSHSVNRFCRELLETIQEKLSTNRLEFEINHWDQCEGKLRKDFICTWPWSLRSCKASFKLQWPGFCVLPVQLEALGVRFKRSCLMSLVHLVRWCRVGGRDPLMRWSRFSRVWLFDPMNCRAPLSIGFSRQEYWSGLPRSPLLRRQKLGLSGSSLYLSAAADAAAKLLQSCPTLCDP